jgi:predicted transcriptional regulator
MFMTLAEHPAAVLSREELDALFHVLRPDAVETVLKRLRDSALLSWDETQRRYSITPLAQQLAAALSPLASAAPAEGELAGLLARWWARSAWARWT